MRKNNTSSCLMKFFSGPFYILFRYWKLTLIFCLCIICALLYFHKKGSSMVSLEIGSEKKIDITPEEIRSIRSIGEWEFLSISTEELVDTTESHFFGDKQLVRIYNGTLRLGINLKKTKEDWVRAYGDTVYVKLPPIELLDKNFINETRTRPFFEKGNWDGKAREALYRKAQQQMIARCVTPQTLKEAQENAITQFSSLFRAFGFNVIKISFLQK